MIDPAEVIIALFSESLPVKALVEERVAGKTNYGGTGGWTVGQASLILLCDGGTARPGSAMRTIRVEARCYAEDQPRAMALYQVVAYISNLAQRILVPITEGKALLYYVLPESEPSFFFDDDVQMDMVIGLFSVAVCVNPVT